MNVFSKSRGGSHIDGTEKGGLLCIDILITDFLLLTFGRVDMCRRPDIFGVCCIGEMVGVIFVLFILILFAFDAHLGK